MVNARLRESQSPGVKVTHSAEGTPDDRRQPVAQHELEAVLPSRGWPLTNEVRQGDECGTYIGLDTCMDDVPRDRLPPARAMATDPP